MSDFDSEDDNDNVSDFLQATHEHDACLMLKAELNSKEMEVIESRQRQIRLMNTAREAQEQLESALSTKDEVIHRLEEALEAMEARLSEAERSKQELSSLAESAAKELENQKNKNEDKKKSFVDLQARLQAAERRNVQLEGQLSSSNREIQSAAEKRAQDEQEIRTIKITASDKIEAAASQLRRAEKALEQEKSERADLEKEVNRRDKELAQLRHQHQALTSQVNKLKRLFDAGGICLTRTALDADSPMIDSGDSILLTLERNFLSLQEHLKDKETVAKKYKAACRSLKGKYESLQTKSIRQKEEMKKLLVSTRQALKDSQLSEQQAREEISDLRRNNYETAHLLASKNAFIKRKEEDSDSFQTKIQEYESAIKDLEQDFFQQKRLLLSETQQAKSQLAQQCEQNRKLNDAKIRLEQESVVAQNKATEAEHRLQETASTVNHYNQKVDLITERLEALQREYNQQKERANHVDRQNQALQQHVAEHENALATKNRLLTDQGKKLMSVERKATTLESDKKELTEELTCCREQMAQQEQTLDDLKRLNVQLEEAQKADQRRVACLRGQIVAKDHQLDETSSKLKEVSEKKTEMQRLISKAEHLLHRIRSECESKVAEQKKETERSKTEMAAQLNRAINEKELAEAHVEELSEALRQNQASKDSMEQLVESLKRDVQVKANGLKESEQRSQRLEGVLKACLQANPSMHTC